MRKRIIMGLKWLGEGICQFDLVTGETLDQMEI